MSAHIDGMHVSYLVDLPGGPVVGALYVATTCGALLLSTDRWIRAFGMVNLMAVGVLVWLVVGDLTSLWCVWAAITSVAIGLFLRETGRRPDLAFA